MNTNLPSPAIPGESTRLENVAPLQDVAEHLKRTLRPVTPAPEFRARLRAGLRMAAHHHHAQRLLISTRAQPHWGWLVGAAAVGSAAGLAAILLRSRQTHHAAARQVTQ